MDAVKGKGVDRVDDVTVAVRRWLPVALEGVLACLRFGRVLKPLYGNAALDAARSVARVIGHAGESARQVPQRRLALLPGLEVGTAAALSEQRLYGVEVVDVDDAASHGDDYLGGADGEGLRFAGQRDSERRAGWVLGIVQIQAAVPRGGDEDAVVCAVADVADGSGVLADEDLFAVCEVNSANMLVNKNLLLRDATAVMQRIVLYLLTAQSMPAVYASSSLAPKHTSSTGALCSYALASLASLAPLDRSYR